MQKHPCNSNRLASYNANKRQAYSERAQG